MSKKQENLAAEVARLTAAVEERDAQLLLMSERMDVLVETVEKFNKAPTAGTIVSVANAIIYRINSIDHSVGLPGTQQRSEYWKAGGRAVLGRVNGAIREAALTLVAHAGPATDSELFAYWIQEAATRPARIAKALSHATTPHEYREALHALVEEDKNAAIAGRINPEGGLVQ